MSKKEDAFIESLLKLTRHNSITWLSMRRYLDNNTNYKFQDHIVDVLEKNYKFSNCKKDYLRLEDSFVTIVDDSIIFLLWIDKEHTLFIQNSIETRLQRTSFSTDNSDGTKLLLQYVQDNISSEDLTMKKIIDLAKDLDSLNF